MIDSGISILTGKTLTQIEGAEGKIELRFHTSDGGEYLMYHAQDCCEDVRIQDICGDLKDLLGSPILSAEASSSYDRPSDLPAPEWEQESETWTFYKLATIKGSVTVRWWGTSNGYYSEGVSFVEIRAPKGEAA